MAYANGRIPATALVRAANGTPAQLLEPQTAKQWAVMVAWAARDGVTLKPEPDDGVPSCYRSYAAQEHAKAVQQAGGPTAATPGHSNHGYGTAVDIAITSTVFAWLRKNSTRYGFDNVEGASAGENWHWVNTHTVNVPYPPKPATPTTFEEDDTMALKDRIFIYKDTSHPYYELLAGDQVRKISSAGWAVLRLASSTLKQPITLLKVSAATYKQLTGK